MRRRLITVAVVLVLAAGAIAAIAVSHTSDGGAGDTARLVTPGPHFVFSPPADHADLPPCTQLRRTTFMSAEAASVVGGVVELSGRLAYVTCVGGGKVTVAQENKSRLFRMNSDVAVLRRTTSGTVAITAGQLPLYLADPTRFAGAAPTKTFELRGTPQAIIRLIEVPKL
jgi:hypothetical protein